MSLPTPYIVPSQTSKSHLGLSGLSQAHTQLGHIDSTVLLSTGIAVICHIIFIFGITFTQSKSPAQVAKDVALSMSQTQEKNDNATFIANASQEGGGSISDKKRLQSTDISPLTEAEIQKTQDLINQQRMQRQRQYQQSYLSTTLSYRKEDEENDNKEENQDEAFEEQQEKIRQEIATLEAQLSQQAQTLATKTKIKTIDSNATTTDGAAMYLNKFRRHVESVANEDYPSKAVTNQLEGDVRLMVIIKADGNLKAIRLLESSGSVILDEAAKNSVRQAAPFGKFTESMKDIVELRIIRTWRYADTTTQVFKN